jgi:lipid-binding SYLF domain-containing protein
MLKLKNLFTFGDVLIFLSASVNADLFAQDCPQRNNDVVQDNDSAAVTKSSEQAKRHKPARPEEVVVAEKVTVTDIGPDRTEEEVLVARKYSVRKVSIPEYAVKEAARARKAAHIVEGSNMWDSGIMPPALLENAEAVAVFPNVVKGAFVIGGRWGKGLMSRRDKCGNWMAPSFVNITGGSFGFQLGVEATDMILVFTDDDAIDSLLKAKLELGVDAAGAAGPIGRRAAVGTDVLLQSGIYSYSKTKGVFAGVSLHGATITIDDSSNENAYSRHIHGEEILEKPEVELNSVVEPFVVALDEFAPRRAAKPKPSVFPSSDVDTTQ